MSRMEPINLGLKQTISRNEEINIEGLYVKEMNDGRYWMNFGINPYHTLIYKNLEDLEHDKIILEKYAKKFA